MASLPHDDFIITTGILPPDTASHSRPIPDPVPWIPSQPGTRWQKV